MKESNFDRLMQRYVTGKVSDRERVKIEAWLKMMKAESGDDLELGDEAEERLLHKIMNPGDSVEDVIALYPRRSLVTKIFTKQWVRLAASVVILLSVSFAVWNALHETGPVQVVASGGREKLILNDGTLVWLQQGSKFTYYQREDGTRHAELVGEAFFEVAKIPNSTFTITCRDIAVRVLGTSFRLKTEQQGVELKVLTGKVNLSSNQDATGVDVLPNEKVTYTVKGEIERAPLGSGEVSEIIAGTEYSMLFDNATMDKVIGQIGRKFDVTVTAMDTHLLKCHVTVDLTDNSLNNTLAMLTDLLNVSYRIDGKKVELSGKGCDDLN